MSQEKKWYLGGMAAGFGLWAGTYIPVGLIQLISMTFGVIGILVAIVGCMATNFGNGSTYTEEVGFSHSKQTPWTVSRSTESPRFGKAAAGYATASLVFVAYVVIYIFRHP